MAFHANHGLFFQRQPDGEVWIEKRVPLVAPNDDHTSSQLFAVAEHWNLTPSEWASVVASMSGAGETGETYREALRFHRKKRYDPDPQ